MTPKALFALAEKVSNHRNDGAKWLVYLLFIRIFIAPKLHHW